MVYDSVVNYLGKEHAGHLISAIRLFYPVAGDCTGSVYCVITLYWYYQKLTVDRCMPGYAASARNNYQHKIAQWQQHSPYKLDRPRYGAKQQITRKLDT